MNPFKTTNNEAITTKSQTKKLINKSLWISLTAAQILCNNNGIIAKTRIHWTNHKIFIWNDDMIKDVQKPKQNKSNDEWATAIAWEWDRLNIKWELL